MAAVRDSVRIASKAVNGTDAALGRRIAALRAEAGLSLRALAAASGVSSSMLSDIERGAKSPTIAVLSAVAAGLNVRLSELLEDAPEHDARVAVRRASAGVADARGVRRVQLAPRLRDAGCEIVRMTLPRCAGTGALGAHRRDTVEYVSVLQGAVDVTAGAATHQLEEGDTIAFAADVRHEYVNRGRAAAVVLVVLQHPRASHD